MHEYASDLVDVHYYENNDSILESIFKGYRTGMLIQEINTSRFID